MKRGLSVNEFFALSNQAIRKYKSIQTLEDRLKHYSEDLKEEMNANKENVISIISKHVEIGAMSDGSLSS